MRILIEIINILILYVPILLGMAFLTLAERKTLAAMQIRRGPNVVGWTGLLQPFADAVKLFIKETIIPSQSNPILFAIAPVVTLTLALITWLVIPLEKGIVITDINVGLLFLFAISSLGIFGVLGSGWASNSKYAFIGALRSTAQMISYEVVIGLMLLCVIVCVGSFNFTKIIISQEYLPYIFSLLPIGLIFFISGLAETNRSPFDLPEGESELVSGYNVEYSSMTFALFFLGEYIHILLMSSFYSLIFLGGSVVNSVLFSLKILIIVFMFLWVRASFPRYRYDQLMSLVWKTFLPFTLGYFIFVTCLLYYLNSYPAYI